MSRDPPVSPLSIFQEEAEVFPLRESPAETWCERVLRELAEAQVTSSGTIARPTGMKDINVKDIEFNQILQVLELCQVPKAFPVIPPLNLSNIKRDIDEEDEYSEEDFENKVGSEAIGMTVPKPVHSVRARVGRDLTCFGHSDEHGRDPAPPKATSKTLKTLAQYCDDLTLLMKPRGPKKTMSKSKSAVQLPPLVHEAGRNSPGDVAPPLPPDLTRSGWHYPTQAFGMGRPWVKHVNKPQTYLQVILQRHSRQSQPLDEEELEAFHKRVTIDAKTEAVDKAFQVITTLRLLGWAPRLRPLGIAQPEAQEWVKFPKVDQRPTFYWNRRTEQSRWSLPSGLPQLWHLLRPERRRLQLALAALCASSSVNLSYPYLMGRLVDMFGEGQEGLLFVMDHTALCGLLVVAGGAATFCRLYLIETAIERIAFRLRQQILGLLSPVLALFVTGVLYGRLVRRIAERRQQRLAEAVQRAEERLGGIRTVRTFNAEARELRGFEGLLDLVYQAGWQNALASAGLSCFFVTGGGLFLLHIIYNCGVMVSSGVVSVGTTVSLAMYCLMAGSSYTGVMAAYGDIQKCLGSLQKVLDILGTAEVRPALSQSVAAASGAASAPLAVKFENVSFFYPARPQANVLQGLNLDIPAGARVAILGRSGSGKSTIALLLAGLYAPTEGKIWVDGHDMVAEDRTAWVRSQLGVISQEPTLFAMSIKENVEYGLSPDPVDQASNDLKVKEAAAAAHVTEFTDGLPHGMDTLAGERGQALSGGQKQRVCIARALARTPRMLIFDEATSALDLRSERAVHEALQEVLSSQNCSCLVITHRMSSLQWCDHVAVVEEGAVVQYGALAAI
eukprot:g11335.t1